MVYEENDHSVVYAPDEILPLEVTHREGDINGKKVIIQRLAISSWQWRIIFAISNSVVVDMVGHSTSDREAQEAAKSALASLNKGKIVE